MDSGSTGDKRRIRKVSSRIAAPDTPGEASTAPVRGPVQSEPVEAVTAPAPVSARPQEPTPTAPDIVQPPAPRAHQAPRRVRAQSQPDLPVRATPSGYAEYEEPPRRAARDYLPPRRSRNSYPPADWGTPRRRPVDRYVAVAIAAVLLVALAVLVFFLATASKPVTVVTVPTTVAGGGVAATDTPQLGIVVDLTATPVNLFASTGGEGGSNRGQFQLPRGLALDAQGNFYVADTQNLRVQKFDKSGNFVTMFGSKGQAEGEFNPYISDSTGPAVGTGPGGVAVDKDGNIYVADTWNHRMQKFSADGKFLLAWGGVINLAEAPAGGDPENNSRFYGPRGVAIGPDGSVYVTDTGNKRVLIFDSSGKYLRKIDSGVNPAKAQANYPFNKPGELNEPIGIAVDGAGNVYVADTRNDRIQKFGPDGAPLAQWPMPTGAWTPGPYLEPFFALDSSGNLYTTAPTGSSVIKFNPQGQVVGEKKTQGSIALKTPTGIAVAPDGTVYVVDTALNVVVNMGTIP